MKIADSREIIISRGALVPEDNNLSLSIEEDLNLIKSFSQKELDKDSVYIRSMYLCSDRMCPSDWGRFSVKALEQIAKLAIGKSVLVGHDKSSLPIARFFKAEIIQKPDTMSKEITNWVRAFSIG